MLRFRLELAQSELDSVIPVIATTDIQDMATIRVTITDITGILHITERTITMVGPITAAIDITSITSVITTAIKATG
jgi:hypothetical protein